MALGLIQPLTEMSTRNFSLEGKGGQCFGLTLPFCLEIGSLKLLEPSGPIQVYNGIVLPLPLHLSMYIGYSHVFIHQLKSTVATLPTA
jgi:hypothetical protein